jgi:TRAP-type C4-dicarboxylate transport system substrate-binding protein
VIAIDPRKFTTAKPRTRTRAAQMALAAALAIVTTACGGSGADKAGGSQPVVLTLATHDDDYAHESFAAAVKRASGGSMRIEVVNNWRAYEVEYERGIVDDVRTGKVELGIVGVRVWDTLGVNSFQALVAPFLVDSLALERRALASPLAARTLARLARRGVVGVALLPGRLRRPFGITRALVRPEDYRGATIGIRPGGVARATVRALGATARGYVSGALSGVDGTELDPATIVLDSYDEQARALTANVVLWPKAQTIVMNRKAFDALTSEQQEILRAAGRSALEPELARIERDERTGLSALCKRGKLRFATARRADLAALREAVRSVYDELERDPLTKRWIAELIRLRGADVAASPQALQCPRPGAGGADKSAESKLEGRWRFTRAPVQELLDAGMPRKLAETLARGGPKIAILVFEDGRQRTIDLGSGEVISTGTYDVEGDIVRLVFATGVGVQLGQAYELRWSVYRDKLAFSAVPGRQPLQALTVKPLTRAR